MNCESFDEVVTELVLCGVPHSEALQQAAAHADECMRCRTRLADERALTSGLRALVRATKGLGAPDRVELVLRAAFRERHAAPVRSKRRVGWAVAAAAAVVLVALVFSFSRVEQPPQQPPARDFSEETPGPAAPEIPAPSAPSEMAENQGPVRPVRRARSSLVPRQRPEIATDFLPLMHIQSLTPIEGGRIVRVELPRSSLTMVGLPMNVERQDDRIKADILVGDDGLAHAIRFVRQQY